MPGLDSTGADNGANRWVEVRLFEILGGWVTTTAEPDIKLMLDRHSFHHAWRAGQWWDRLPVVAGTDPAALTAAPGPGWAAALDRLAQADAVVSRLAGAYRFALPRLATRYRRQQATVDPVGDSSTLRTLDIVSRDLAGDWLEGETALQDLIAGADVARTVSDTVADLEQLLLQG